MTNYTYEIANESSAGLLTYPSVNCVAGSFCNKISLSTSSAMNVTFQIKVKSNPVGFEHTEMDVISVEVKAAPAVITNNTSPAVIIIYNATLTQPTPYQVLLPQS